MELARELKTEGHELYLGTNQDAVRTEYIRRQAETTSVFNRVYPSYELGVCKPSSEFYSKLLQKLCPQSSEKTVVIDDDQRNIQAAEQIGLIGLYFNPDLDQNHSTNSLREALASVLN